MTKFFILRVLRFSGADLKFNISLAFKNIFEIMEFLTTKVSTARELL